MDIKNATDFIAEANTLQNCMNGVKDYLESVRGQILQTGLKNSMSYLSKKKMEYSDDGHEQYRTWAKALDRSIELLEHQDSSIPEVLESLKTLRLESEHYFDSHYGMFGFPIHKYGRTRLNQSGELFRELPALALTLTNCQNKVNAAMQGADYGNTSMNQIMGRVDVLKNTYPKVLIEDEMKGRSFEQERRVPDAQFKAFDQFYKHFPDMAKYYRPSHIDDCLQYVRDWSDSVAVSARAEVFAAVYPVQQILKKGIGAEEAERRLEEYTPFKCDQTVRKLTGYDLFDQVQRICFKKKPDTGLSTWAFIEDVTEKLTEAYKSEKFRDGNQVSVRANIRHAYAETDEQIKARESGDLHKSHLNKMENVYKKAADILVNRALADPKGRRLLHMVAMERSDDKINAFKEHAKNYLMHKNLFANKKGGFDPEKVSRYMEEDVKLQQDILESYYKTNPKITLRFNGEYRFMGNEVQPQIKNPKTNAPANIKPLKQIAPLKPFVP